MPQLTPVPGARPRYKDGVEVIEVMTCGHCGRSWNDAAVSSLTPVPAGRCPFEYEHEYDEEEAFVEVTFSDGTSARWGTTNLETQDIADLIENKIGPPDTIKP